MSPEAWAQLTTALVIPHQAHREARLHIARGGPARRKPAGGYPPALTLPEMILATVLRARFGLPLRVLAELFGVVTGTIANADRMIRPLLDQRLPVIEPAGTSFKTLAELSAYAAAHGVTLTQDKSRKLIICKLYVALGPGAAARTQITGGLSGRVLVLICVKPALPSRFSTSSAALRDVSAVAP